MSEKEEVVMTDSANQDAGDDLAKRLILEAEKQGKEPGFLTIHLDGRETSRTVTPQ